MEGNRKHLFSNSIVICPTTDPTGGPATALSECGHIRALETFQQYRSKEGLSRFLQAAGSEIVFLSIEDIPPALELALAIDRAGIGTQLTALSRACDQLVFVERMQMTIREFLSLPLDTDRLNEGVCRINEVLEQEARVQDDRRCVQFLARQAQRRRFDLSPRSQLCDRSALSGKTLHADFDLNLGMAFLLKVTNAWMQSTSQTVGMMPFGTISS
jgi:hypothetical protein